MSRTFLQGFCVKGTNGGNNELSIGHRYSRTGRGRGGVEGRPSADKKKKKRLMTAGVIFSWIG